ncbi:MAG: exonuclease SbcCD subunit D [Thermoleophilia bacterium]|nr:exonuclease SbcCD subunit D [Thermoleophilia bacterium]
MKFIHTADWHLGRLFHSIHLTDDQRFTLEGMVQMAGDRRVDAVIVAGDVFDRAVPSTEAIDLLDDIVGTLALDLKIPVVMIAGNHDSASRLEFFSGLVRRAGVYVVGRVGARPQPVEILAADGTSVRFWPLAYTDPETARYELGRDDIHSHEDVLRAQLEAIGPALGGGTRDVLVAHAFVSGCRESESERPLTVGGAGAVGALLFEQFDYVALGHLHQTQVAGAGSVRYAGSLLKYSFDEEAHQKSVSLVDLGRSGPAVVEEVRLPVKRDVRRLRGEFDEILSAQLDPVLAEAYVEVVLTDSEPVLSPLDRLRPLFPHILSIRREAAEAGVFGPGPTSAGLKARTVLDLFGDFFEDVRGSPLNEPQTAELAAAIDRLERAGREAGPA